MAAPAKPYTNLPAKSPVEVPRRPSRLSRRKAITVIVIAVLVLFLIPLLYIKLWPFSQKSVLEDLAEATGTIVTAQKYLPSYFPPGCALEGVEFRHGDNRFKLIEIQKLVIEGSYVGILRHHVPRITAIGAHVFIPAFGSNSPFQTEHSDLVVDEFVANGSFVEFERKNANEKPVRFDVREAAFHHVKWGIPIGYHLKFRNPSPPGEITAEGDFGPWADGQPQLTPLSGRYLFEHANLSVYGGVAGMLSSQGEFRGELRHINVSGSTVTPDFEVKSSGHKHKLETKFDAYVSGLNGDTFLKRVDARLGHTSIIVEGSIAHTPGRKGKVTRLHFASQQARIEDLLGLFVTERPPMSGDTSLQADVQVPPEDEPFLRKVKLQGTFEIVKGNFTKPETQKDVDQLSAGARGQNKDNPESVLSNLKGAVNLNDGQAHFSELLFEIPGASARMHGTYSILEPHRINLHGQLQVDTQISKTTSGFKSAILKIMHPFFKKKNKGEVVPVHILGTYEKPQYGLDLAGEKAPAK